MPAANRGRGTVVAGNFGTVLAKPTDGVLRNSAVAVGLTWPTRLDGSKAVGADLGEMSGNRGHVRRRRSRIATFELTPGVGSGSAKSLPCGDEGSDGALLVREPLLCLVDERSERKCCEGCCR